jgi:hypothetical protein
MLKILIFLFIAAVNTVKVEAKGKVIPDDRVQNCQGPKVELNEIAHGNIVDADLDFLVSDEENVILNGSLTFKMDIQQGYFVRITGEKLDQGDWHRKTIKNMQDACFDLFNPLDLFYPYFRDFKQCPYQPGVR